MRRNVAQVFYDPSLRYQCIPDERSECRFMNACCERGFVWISQTAVAFVEAPSTAEARRTRVKSGDVLLSITADLGRTAVVPADIGEAYINQHLAILRSSKVDSRFLSAALASPAGQADIMKKNREGVKAGLNFDDVRSIRIPDTPLAIQQAFSERMSEVDKLRSVYRADLDTLDALFVSLQHHAFRGELTSKDVERELAMAG